MALGLKEQVLTVNLKSKTLQCHYFSEPTKNLIIQDFKEPSNCMGHHIIGGRKQFIASVEIFDTWIVRVSEINQKTKKIESRAKLEIRLSRSRDENFATFSACPESDFIAVSTTDKNSKLSKIFMIEFYQKSDTRSATGISNGHLRIRNVIDLQQNTLKRLFGVGDSSLRCLNQALFYHCFGDHLIYVGVIHSGVEEQTLMVFDYNIRNGEFYELDGLRKKYQLDYSRCLVRWKNRVVSSDYTGKMLTVKFNV